MIKSIFAVDHWGGMGFNGTLPWPHCREDLQHFKARTQGDIIVMGRKTYDDPKMPKPLPDRTTYVVTHRPLKGVFTIQGDIQERVRNIEASYPNKTIWIIGGPEILLATRNLVTEAHVTHFRGQFRSDVQLDMRKYFLTLQARSSKPHPEHVCTWMVYKNIDIFKY
jgi:dihydrofolate reductase